MSTRKGRSRDNSNSETAGRLANWQNPPDTVVPYTMAGSQSPDVEALRKGDYANADYMAASLDSALPKDEKVSVKSSQTWVK